MRSPKAPRRRAVIFRSHGLLQIKQGTLRFPCAGCRQLPFCGLAVWGHLALQAVPMAYGKSIVKAMDEAGLKIEIQAPTPEAPSVARAIELYLAAQK